MPERVVTPHDRAFPEALQTIQAAHIHPEQGGYSATQLRQVLYAHDWEPSEDAPDGQPGVAVRASKQHRPPLFGRDTIRRRGSDAVVAWVLLLADALRANQRRLRPR